MKEFETSAEGASLSARTDELVQQYRGFAKATAENYMAAVEIVYVAKKELGKERFKVFCQRVHLDPDGSELRKMMVIAKAANKLLSYAERLPSASSTLYKLARCKPDQLKTVADHPRFGKDMTAAEVDRALGREHGNRVDPSILLRLKKLRMLERQEVAVAIDQLNKRFTGRIKIIVHGFELLPRTSEADLNAVEMFKNELSSSGDACADQAASMREVSEHA